MTLGQNGDGSPSGCAAADPEPEEPSPATDFLEQPGDGGSMPHVGGGAVPPGGRGSGLGLYNTPLYQ
jgi:hypothetical protein